MMSEQVIEQPDDLEEIGQTSTESESESSSSSWKDGFNIYNAMLIVSAACILLATILMFMQLRNYGSILSGEFPWRTSDAITAPLSK